MVYILCHRNKTKFINSIGFFIIIFASSSTLRAETFVIFVKVCYLEIPIK